MEDIQVAKKAVLAAKEKKAEKIVLQDVQGLSDICSLQMICSGLNIRQTQAICLSIEMAMKEQFAMRPIAIEGRQTGQWILMDYGHMIIHIFDDEIRDHYALDSLWESAKNVDLSDSI